MYSKVGEEPVVEYIPDTKLRLVRELDLSLIVSEYVDHHRLMVYAVHGTECACCGVLGTRLVENVDPGGGLHIDVFTDDWVMITVDHIIPRSRGGGEEIENKQPLCALCNSEKRSLIISNDDLMDRISDRVLSIRSRYAFAMLNSPKLVAMTAST